VCAKPVPDTVTIVPRGPDVGLSVIDEDVTVNVADAPVGAAALSVTVIVSGPDVDGRLLMMTLVNVPVALDAGCDTGVTFVPLNVKWRRELLAKPVPDTLIMVPEPPDVGLSVIDEAVCVMWLVSSVTAPVSAISLPFTAALVVAVIDAWAIMVPFKLELVPRVAELPTLQKTFEASAPFVRITLLAPRPAAVVSVLFILKM
jgi:hypothetical protein